MANTIQARNKRYNQYVNTKSPKTSPWKSLIMAFIIGGAVCCLGQAFTDILMLIFKDMTLDDAKTWSLVALIVIAVLLTGLGWFDDIGITAGAGTFLPITGFANSVASPAIEFRSEGMIFGLGAKMFYVAGPIIVNGVVFGTLGALLHYLLYSVIFK